jgi:pectin methylesterase-like acyl-CoA thioesterase
MGRSVIADCAVKDLMEGEDVWNAAVKKRLEREIFLKEIVEGNFGTEKKRKRKRKKAPLDADVEDKKVKS